MSRATLAVVCDQLRALGLEDVARWVEHPDAVRVLLRHTPTTERYDEEACPHCEAIHDDTARSIHARTCPVPAAWRALGDPRGQADIERAHEEAWQHHVGRADFQLPRTATHGEWGRGPSMVGTVQRQINERIEAACERILGHRLTVHDRNALTLRHDRSHGGLVHVTILRDDVEQVMISAAVLGDAIDFTEHWRVAEPARRTAHHFASRQVSDARGMEAVEDEARAEWWALDRIRPRLDALDRSVGREPFEP